MFYKSLGFLVWQVVKLFVRRKLGVTRSRVAIAGLGAAVLAGVVAVGRSAAGDA